MRILFDMSGLQEKLIEQEITMLIHTVVWNQ